MIRRRLSRLESRAIINEAKCCVCFKTREQLASGVSLVCCPGCQWGWTCSEHTEEYKDQHAKSCTAFQIMNSSQMLVQSMLAENGKLPSYLPENLKTSFEPLPADGWGPYRRWRPVPMIDPITFAVLTKRLSQPLTVMAGLQAMYSEAELRSMDSVTVHVIGASGFEVPTDNVWEELLHLLPSATQLHVAFIGPELRDILTDDTDGKMTQLNTCAKGCAAKGRKRFYSFHHCPYHTFLQRDMASQPTVAVAFNSGIYEEDKELWKPTLAALIKSDTPTVFTSYNKDEAKGDCEAWKAAGGTIVKEPSENPYRAQEPIFEPSSVDEFYFQNYWWMCVRGKKA